MIQNIKNPTPAGVISLLEENFGQEYPHVINHPIWQGVKGKSKEEIESYAKNLVNSFGIIKDEDMPAQQQTTPNTQGFGSGENLRNSRASIGW